MAAVADGGLTGRSPSSGGGAQRGPFSLAGDRGRRDISLLAAQNAVSDLLAALGQDVADPQLRDTPRRVAAAMAEMLSPVAFSLTTFPNDDRYDELVVVRDIPVHSLCAHHMLPFRGRAHLGYLPGERILGISKLAWMVELFARGLQIQERLTVQVGDWLTEHLQPKGVGVVIEAEHLCMTLRGVQAYGTRHADSHLVAAWPRARRCSHPGGVPGPHPEGGMNNAVSRASRHGRSRRPTTSWLGS